MIGFINIGDNFIIHESQIKSLELFGERILITDINGTFASRFLSEEDARKEFDRLIDIVNKD